MRAEDDAYSIHFTNEGVAFVESSDGSVVRHPPLTPDEQFTPHRLTLLDRMRGAFYGAVSGWRGEE